MDMNQGRSFQLLQLDIVCGAEPTSGPKPADREGQCSLGVPKSGHVRRPSQQFLL